MDLLGWLIFLFCLATLALLQRFFNAVYTRYHV